MKIDILPPDIVKLIWRAYFTLEKRELGHTSMPKLGFEPRTPGTAEENNFTTPPRTTK